MSNQFYHATIKDLGDTMTFDEGHYHEKIEDGKPIQNIVSGESIGFQNSNIKEFCASKNPESAVFATLKNYINKTGDCGGFGIKIPVHVYLINQKPDVDISNSNVGDFSLIDEVRYRNIESQGIKSKRIFTVDIPDEILIDIELSYLPCGGGTDGVIENWGNKVQKGIKQQIVCGKYPEDISTAYNVEKPSVEEYY